MKQQQQQQQQPTKKNLPAIFLHNQTVKSFLMGTFLLLPYLSAFKGFGPVILVIEVSYQCV